MSTLTFHATNARQGVEGAPTIVGGSGALDDASDSTYADIDDPAGAGAYSTVVVDLTSTGTFDTGSVISEILVRVRALFTGTGTHQSMFVNVAAGCDDGTYNPYYFGDAVGVGGSVAWYEFRFSENYDSSVETLIDEWNAGTVQLEIGPNFDLDAFRIYEAEVFVTAAVPVVPTWPLHVVDAGGPSYRVGPDSNPDGGLARITDGVDRAWKQGLGTGGTLPIGQYTMEAQYEIQQSFGGPEPQYDADAHICGWRHARQSHIGFQNWDGSNSGIWDGSTSCVTVPSASFTMTGTVGGIGGRTEGFPTFPFIPGQLYITSLIQVQALLLIGAYDPDAPVPVQFTTSGGGDLGGGTVSWYLVPVADFVDGLYGPYVSWETDHYALGFRVGDPSDLASIGTEIVSGFSGAGFLPEQTVDPALIEAGFTAAEALPHYADVTDYANLPTHFAVGIHTSMLSDTPPVLDTSTNAQNDSWGGENDQVLVWTSGQVTRPARYFDPTLGVVATLPMIPEGHYPETTIFPGDGFYPEG